MLLSVLTPLLSRPTFFTLSSHIHFCYRSEGMFLMASGRVVAQGRRTVSFTRVTMLRFIFYAPVSAL